MYYTIYYIYTSCILYLQRGFLSIFLVTLLCYNTYPSTIFQNLSPHIVKYDAFSFVIYYILQQNSQQALPEWIATKSSTDCSQTSETRLFPIVRSSCDDIPLADPVRMKPQKRGNQLPDETSPALKSIFRGNKRWKRTGNRCMAVVGSDSQLSRRLNDAQRDLAIERIFSFFFFFIYIYIYIYICTSHWLSLN